MLFNSGVEAYMKNRPINRKEFIGALGKIGVGTCLCAAAAGMRAAFGNQAPPLKSSQTAPSTKAVAETKPGDKTVERAAKRMEFGDGWVKRFFDVMDQTVDQATRTKLMTENGKACFIAYAGPRKQHPDPDALEKFSQWIVQNGKEKGYSVEGKVISFEFVGSAETGQASPEGICLCPMVEAQTAGKISPTYCLCSVGYVREMHERILGRPVDVELVDSVLRGGKRCKFKMTVV
jgi:hypothetical protein